MSVSSFLSAIGAGEALGKCGIALVIAFTVLQIMPIKINPWSWLGKKIGGWFDGDKKEEKAEIQKPVKDGKIRIVFDNAPKGMRVENDLDFVKIEINTGLTEA